MKAKILCPGSYGLHQFLSNTSKLLNLPSVHLKDMIKQEISTQTTTYPNQTAKRQQMRQERKQTFKNLVNLQPFKDK